MRQGCTSAASGRHVDIRSQHNPRRRLHRLTAATGAAVAALAVANMAHAATYTWANVGTDWNTGANWGTTNFPNATADLALFATPSPTPPPIVQPNLSASVSIARISFQAGATGYNLTATNGSTITLSSTSTGATAAINSATTVSEEINVPLIFSASSAGMLQTINAGGTMKLSGPITATANALQVTSTGTLQLTNAGNDFSGGLTLAGTSTSKLNFANGALGSSGNLTFTGTTWLQYATGNTQDMSARIVNSTSAISVDPNGNAVTFATPIASTNTGGLTIPAPAVAGGSLTLATANNFTGNTTIAVSGGLSSRLNIQNAGSLGPASNNLVISGNSGLFDNNSSGPLTIANGLQMGGNLAYVGTQDLTVTGAVNYTGSATRTFNVGGSNLTLAGNISSGGQRLGKSGAGTLTLTGNNSALAGVGLNEGRLNIGSANALGTASGTTGRFTTAAGTTFDNVTGVPLTMTNSFAGVDFTFAGSSNMTFNGTDDITVGFSAASTTTHAATLSGTNSTLTLAAALANSVTDATVPTVAINNGLGGSGNTLVIGGAKLSSATSLGMSFGGNANVVVNGPVVDGTQTGGNLTLTGGVWTFTAANTYTGTTTVNGGRFQATSAASLPGYNAAGKVTVNTGGTLGVNAGAPSGQWSETDIATLYANATFNAGSNLAIDTTGGNFAYGAAMGQANGLVKLGANTLTLTAANTYTGGTTVNAGTLLLAHADATAGGAVDIHDGAVAQAQAGLPKSVTLSTLATNSTGKFDLTNNSMVIKGMADAAVRTQLQAGYNAGAWNGPTGIVSTSITPETSVGYATQAQTGITDFKGVTGMADTDLQVKFTYAGDANLDGKVDIGDLGLLAGAWQAASGKVWFDGDFTYDGAVDIGDLGLLSGNWQKGTAGNPNPPLMDFATALSQFSAFDGVVVPEPTTFGLVSAIAVMGLTRRRRCPR